MRSRRPRITTDSISSDESDANGSDNGEVSYDSDSSGTNDSDYGQEQSEYTRVQKVGTPFHWPRITVVTLNS